MRRIGKGLLWLAAALGLAVAGFAIWVRAAPDDPARWSVDPAAIVSEGAANAYVVKPAGEGGDAASPIFDETPAALLARFKAMALAQPRVTLLSDDGESLTLVQRSEIMAFPDYISVRAVPVEGGAALDIYSRSRYGADDLGVNEARISSWLGKL